MHSERIGRNRRTGRHESGKTEPLFLGVSFLLFFPLYVLYFQERNPVIGILTALQLLNRRPFKINVLDRVIYNTSQYIDAVTFVGDALDGVEVPVGGTAGPDHGSQDAGAYGLPHAFVEAGAFWN